MSVVAPSKDREIEFDLPEDREYEKRTVAELDESLVEAIRAAEAADHGFLSRLLRNELKSLYYESRIEV